MFRLQIGDVSERLALDFTVMMQFGTGMAGRVTEFLEQWARIPIYQLPMFATGTFRTTKAYFPVAQFPSSINSRPLMSYTC